MSYHERYEILNKNSVLVERHFQYRAEIFLKVSLRKTQYYTIRVNSQVRGSPHIHSFILILNSPKLTRHWLYQYTKWVDSIVTADQPDAINDPALFELVKAHQIHHHSKTSRNDINEKRRFYFAKFSASRTIIAQPLENQISQDVRYENMQRRSAIWKKVKYYIDDKLILSKKNSLENTKDDYEKWKSID